jgi:hypothetical protein
LGGFQITSVTQFLSSTTNLLLTFNYVSSIIFLTSILPEGHNINKVSNDKLILPTLNIKSKPIDFDANGLTQYSAKVKRIEQERIAAEKARQAEIERIRQEEQKKKEEESKKVVAATGPANKYAWMQEAGIPQSDWWAADFIISKESSWNPYAVNPNGGACNLSQELPCGKSGCSLGDAVCSLRWQHSYVKARYGGYAQAVSFWKANKWY